MSSSFDKRRVRIAAQTSFTASGLLVLTLVAATLVVTQRVVAQADSQAAPDPASAPPPAPPAPAPEVHDPMLAPPPPAATEISSWEQALKLLRTRAPDYEIGRENVIRAEAQSRAALAAVLPTLNAQGSYTHQFFTENLTLGGLTAVTPPPNVWAAGGTLVWPILSPRGLYGLTTASRNSEVARLSFEDRRRQIAVAAVDAMLSALAAGRVAEQNRVGLRTALERRTLAAARFQFGQGTALDLDRADQDVAAARSLLINGDESLRQARESFGVTVGSADAIGVPENFNLEEFESAVARTCKLNKDVERRPDIAAARTRVEVADRAIRDVDYQYLPSLNAVSALAYQTETTLAPKTTWNVQGVLNVPLYDGGLRGAAYRDAQAVAAQARQTLSLARLNALVAAARADRLVGVYQESRDIAQTQRDLAHRIDDRTREGYARGFGTSLDLVTSAQALRQAEINLVLQDFQVGRARANAVLENAECLY
jgi:multidrug efflux system outer membrane protein